MPGRDGRDPDRVRRAAGVRDGTFEFVVPTVVGPRFVAARGRAGRRPRRRRRSRREGTRAGHDLSIAVDLDAGVPIGDVTSPLHAITVERPAPSAPASALANQREIPNRDFVLRYDGRERRAAEHRPRRIGRVGGDGYVTLVLLPPKRMTAETAAPKELVFVIDRSGSQAGAPLDKAKETMRWIIDHLNPHDTFQIVDFGSTQQRRSSRSRGARPPRRRAARAPTSTRCRPTAAP